MTADYRRHFVTTERDRGLPLHLTSIGFAEYQGAIQRENGFPDFHWLHTVSGSGVLTAFGRTIRLLPNQGLLLKPGVPHQYAPETAVWSSWYLTFDGALANPIVSSLDIPHGELLSWDENAPLAKLHLSYREKLDRSYDLAGTNGSLEAYALLAAIKQHGQSGGRTSISKGHERLAPIYALIEERYGDPNLGLDRLAEELRISPQYLNKLFRASWGVSPYRYLMQFRIQKSKELLLADRARTVKDVSTAAGFQDDSHFVHTSRKLSGLTPVQFRLQFGE